MKFRAVDTLQCVNIIARRIDSQFEQVSPPKFTEVFFSSFGMSRCIPDMDECYTSDMDVDESEDLNLDSMILRHCNVSTVRSFILAFLCLNLV